jgi:hypothetical protein
MSSKEEIELPNPTTEKFLSMFRRRFMKGITTVVKIAAGIVHSGGGMTLECLSYTI